MFGLFESDEEEMSMEEAADKIEKKIINQGSEVLKNKLKLFIEDSKYTPRADSRQLNYPDDYIAMYIISGMMSESMAHSPEIDLEKLTKENVKRIKKELLF